MLRVSYTPGYFAPIGANHVFPMSKFEGLHHDLVSRGVIEPDRVVHPRQVDLSDLRLVHTREYIDGIVNGNLNPRDERRLGLPWSQNLAIRSRLAVQGTMNAALMALNDGLAGNLAGGTHHAMPGHGEGFCVFNDVAVAVRVLKRSMWVRKVLIIDCDVHQGNGNAFIFRDDPDVYTFSMHGEKNYPFRKPPSTLDIGLRDGTGDADYLRILNDALLRIFSEFTPDLVFYLGGIDPLKDDYFGRLSLSLEGLRRREESVIKFIKKQQVPLVLLLSGGYAPSVEATVQAHAQMFEAAREIYG